jgi:hypothetical protein
MGQSPITVILAWAEIQLMINHNINRISASSSININHMRNVTRYYARFELWVIHQKLISNYCFLSHNKLIDVLYNLE